MPNQRKEKPISNIYEQRFKLAPTLENGGEKFDLIPCLNDSEDHINLFEKL